MSERDRPANGEEIEVTPEMIEAGAEVAWLNGAESPRDVAWTIYHAMEVSRRALASRKCDRK